jgi:hypothetical protein
MATNVIALRTPRYSAALAAEAWMEIAENARRLVTFAEDELRLSFRAGDVRRLRTLQGVHRDATRVMAEGRRLSAWADAACADGVARPGHGAAA